VVRLHEADEALRPTFNCLPLSDLVPAPESRGLYGTEGGPVYREAATGRVWFAPKLGCWRGRRGKVPLLSYDRLVVDGGLGASEVLVRA
jgi:hypothetical protein